MVDYKNIVKELIYNYASPVPYMARENWAPVAFYGVSKPALANVARNYYGDAINKILGNVDWRTNRELFDFMNDLRNRNNHYYMNNAMKYGEYPMYPLDWDDTRLPEPKYPEKPNYDL